MKCIYLDENLSQYLADGLNSFCKGHFTNIRVESTIIRWKRGISDEELIPEIGKEKSFLITKDVNIHTTRLQAALCIKHGIGIFFLKLPKNSSKHWDMVEMIVRRWREIVKIVESENLPFSYFITPKKISKA